MKRGSERLGLRASSQGTLSGDHFLWLELAERANQDDAGHTSAFHALHIPTVANGFLNARQWMIAIPASSFARGADRVQRIVHVQHNPLLCLNCAQTHLQNMPTFCKNRCPSEAGHPSRKKVMEPYQIFVSPRAVIACLQQPPWILKDLEHAVI